MEEIIMISDAIFSLSPNPRYFYITPSAKAAIAKTKYVIRQRLGLTTIIGDVGLGKTSLLRLMFQEYVDDPDYAAAFIVNPKERSETTFLKSICREFGVRTRLSLLDTEYEFRDFLTTQLQTNRHAIVFIDESQQLRGPMFEMIRQILNFETDTQKLITIVLAGQIELRYKLADVSKRALVSRIAVSSTLDALTLDETKAMLDFRCSVAEVTNPFSPDAIAAIYQYSKGVPREILKLGGLSVDYAKTNQQESVTQEFVELAYRDLPKIKDLPIQKDLPTQKAKAATPLSKSKAKTASDNTLDKPSPPKPIKKGKTVK
jgi:general secretion pathway protein A